jgi:hypothetical protein
VRIAKRAGGSLVLIASLPYIKMKQATARHASTMQDSSIKQNMGRLITTLTMAGFEP